MPDFYGIFLSFAVALIKVRPAGLGKGMLATAGRTIIMTFFILFSCSSKALLPLTIQRSVQ
jgi:hypothetical protein